MLQTRRRYSIHTVRDEVQALVSKGVLGKRTQLLALARHFDDDTWQEIDHILAQNEYLLRDSVCDLIGHETWLND